MFCPAFGPRSRGLVAWALISLLYTASNASAQDPRCGSLITYRQYEILVENSPQCFISGCNADAASISMSTPCATGRPCSKLWDLLRQQWQGDWCASCGGDVACRIDGWPILNSTSACSQSPNDWLFSASGACCAQGDEPFQLADWVGQLCNGSQWRAPFDYYGGMAPLDWAEWIVPWNWTVQPQNSSTRNYTLSSYCPTSGATIRAIMFDNLFTLIEALVEVIISWFILVRWAKNRTTDPAVVRHIRGKVKTVPMAIVGGVFSGSLYILSNFVTAIVWQQYWPDYENINRGLLGLALCSRPSILPLLCFIGFGSSKLAELLERWRRKTENDVDPNSDGAPLARQLLANLALTLAVAELLVQVSGCIVLFWASHVGAVRGFYYRDSLVPFWRGTTAVCMYIGSMFHSIFFIPTLVFLVLSTYLHVDTAKGQKFLARQKWANRLLAELSNYYIQRRRWDQITAEIHEANAKKQAILKQLLDAMQGIAKLGITPGGGNIDDIPTWKKAWRLCGRVSAAVARWVVYQFADRRPPASHDEVLANIIPDREAPPLPRRGGILSHRPFSTILLGLFKYTERARLEEQRRNMAKYLLTQPPSEAELEELEARLRALEQQGRPNIPWREFALGFVFVCFLVNYGSQVIFWVTFVRSSGER